MKRTSLALAVIVILLFASLQIVLADSAITIGMDNIPQNHEIYVGVYVNDGSDGNPDWSGIVTNYTVPWIVLDKNGFLLSKYLLGISWYRQTGPGYYKGSDLQAYIDTGDNSLYNKMFTEMEKEAILAKDIYCNDRDISSPAIIDAHLYPLSYTEANNLILGSEVLTAKYITNIERSGWWWLRSSENNLFATCIDIEGHQLAAGIGQTDTVRPAMNLNLANVLFASAVKGGKVSGPVGADALIKNTILPSTNQWRLTLIDNERRRFAINSTQSAQSFTINYTGAFTGPNEYISAIVTDAANKVLYYGRIRNLLNTEDTRGTVVVNMPPNIPTEPNTTLYIFNEQYNGGISDDTQMTDYSSLLHAATPIPVEINETTFPDANFRNAVLANYSDGNGHVNPDILTIDVADMHIQDLTGIEHFPSLITLHCYNNYLSSLDITNNIKLEVLYCSTNMLTSLDVLNNTSLRILLCSDNQLTSLDVSRNTALISLRCYNNRLTSLDLSKQISLLSGNIVISDQQSDALFSTYANGIYQVDLVDLPGGETLDFSRITMTDGGILDQHTGRVTYVSQPSQIAYAYDTRLRNNEEITFMSILILCEESPSTSGDTNDDGSVDIMDLVVIVDYIVNGNAPASMAAADANGDGSVDIMDLVFIIDLIVNPPVNSAPAASTVRIEVPFHSSTPITALELAYSLSPGLTFVNAECSGMVGAGGSTNALFANVNGGLTSGAVTLEVALNAGVTADQSVTVTAVTGANTAGPRAVGSPQTYIIDVNASVLSILTQPADAMVSVGNTATFTVEAAGPEPLTYQWYVNTNTGVGWLAVAGATEAAYTTGAAVIGDDGFRYFCRVTSGNAVLEGTDNAAANEGARQYSLAAGDVATSIDSTIATLTVVASPQTGDGSSVLALISIALLAAGGIGALLLYRRHKSGKKEK